MDYELQEHDRESNKIEPDKRLEDFINQCIDLIKNNQFKEAVKKFGDKKMAGDVGFIFGSARGFGVTRIPDQAMIKSLINNVRLNSIFMHASDPPTINLATVYGIDFSLGVKELELPSVVYQDVALIHAEEWLHGLQYLRGRPIAGYDDPEIDVAFYLHNHGVVLTKSFLESHDRSKYPELNDDQRVT